MDFQHLWIEQCEAAREIKERYGTQNALDYLVEEKLLNFIEASETDPGLAEQLPLFVSEVASIFSKGELQQYFRSKKKFRHASRQLVSYMRQWLLALKASNVLLLRPGRTRDLI